MTFLSALALTVGLLVGLPFAAHLLRRRRAGEVVLPTARLLTTSPPTARRRSALEDRALLGVRTLAVLLLALLGATPFVSCSHLTLDRKDGGSVALVFVIDDSLSMRAKSEEAGPSRFEVARKGALDLLASAHEGDTVAVVLAGAGARVHLASTTDLGAARSALESLEPSDRATDLEAAIQLAADLAKAAPQRDRRIVLLSDLADGTGATEELDLDGDEVALWFPLPGLRARSEADCGIVSAERAVSGALVRVVCTKDAVAQGRKLEIVGESGVVASGVMSPGVATLIELPASAPADLDARLAPGDAIPQDDLAPVAPHGRDLSIAVVSDAAATRLETGGAPPVEQALTALDLGPHLHALPSVPDHVEGLTSHAGLVLDDPPGLTPEERRAVASWIEGGGTLLLSLGPRAAAAPLGAGFGTIVPGVVRFRAGPTTGALPAACGFLGGSAASLDELASKGHSALDHEAIEGSEVLCPFVGGDPLLLRRTVGRGTVLLSTLPFDVETSDFPLRPAFLSLLDRFVESARARGGARAVEAGQVIVLPGFEKVTAQRTASIGAAPEPALVSRRAETATVTTSTIGRYSISLDGEPDLRVALVAEREIDLRPRPIATRALDASLGGQSHKLDASPYIALGLLALLAIELALRIALRGKDEPTTAKSP